MPTPPTPNETLLQNCNPTEGRISKPSDNDSDTDIDVSINETDVPRPLRCPDCAAWPGYEHTDGCDVARCVQCSEQRLSCNCKEGIVPNAIWTGLWPGEQECLEYGILREDGRPDLNRFMMFVCPANSIFRRKCGLLYWDTARNRYISDDPKELKERMAL